MARPIAQKRLESTIDAGHRGAQPLGRTAACPFGRQVAGTTRQVPAERLWRHQPAIEQRRQPGPQAPLAELREHQRHVLVGSGETSADAQRLVQRFADQAWCLGVVCEAEPGIDVRLERELPQERETERVDRRDGDVAKPLPQLAPPRQIELGVAARLAQSIDDALAHLGGGFARERDREDVLGIDAGAQEVDVALDQYTRLARAGRGLEHHVLCGIDSKLPGGLVNGHGPWASRDGRRVHGGLGIVVAEGQPQLRHRRCSPCGTPR